MTYHAQIVGDEQVSQVELLLQFLLADPDLVDQVLGAQLELELADRPSFRAATPVMPEPAKGSTTSSPGALKASMKGSIAAMGTFVR